MKPWESAKSKQKWLYTLESDMIYIHSLLKDIMNAYFNYSAPIKDEKYPINQAIAADGLKENHSSPWDFITQHPLSTVALTIQSFTLELHPLLENEDPITIPLQWSYSIQWDNLIAKWYNDIKQMLAEKGYTPDKNLIYGCHFDEWLKAKIKIELAMRQEWYLILSLGDYAAHLVYQAQHLAGVKQPIKGDDFAKQCLARLGITSLFLPAIPDALLNLVSHSGWEQIFLRLIEEVWAKFEKVHEKNNKLVYNAAPLALPYHANEILQSHQTPSFYNKKNIGAPVELKDFSVMLPHLNHLSK